MWWNIKIPLKKTQTLQKKLIVKCPKLRIVKNSPRIKSKSNFNYYQKNYEINFLDIDGLREETLIPT